MNATNPKTLPQGTSSDKPQSSAISHFLSLNHVRTNTGALPLEIMHNLEHQHRWTDLRLHICSFSPVSGVVDAPLSVAAASTTTTTTTSTSNPPSTNGDSPQSQLPKSCFLLSGLPPRHMYIHPDFQTQLLKRNIVESSLPIQREWILPMSIGEKWSLRRFSAVFDALPDRPAREVARVGGEGGGNDTGADTHSRKNEVQWHDAKRVVMAMLSHNGMGGDGTVAYYIMQEGEVKPRQNG